MHRRSMDGAWRVIGIENGRMYGLRYPLALGTGNFKGDRLCGQRIGLRRLGSSPRIAEKGAELVVLLVLFCWCPFSNQ